MNLCTKLFTLNKVILTVNLLCIFAVLKLYPQNLQLHYDFGKDRNFFTSTLEMHKKDNLGFTYFFIDFNFNSKIMKGISSAYFEFSRYFKIPGLNKVYATIQYNDGISESGSMGRAWLIGLYYPFNLKFLSLGTTVLFRFDKGSSLPDFQISLVWFKPIETNKFLLKGYLDIWTKYYNNRENKKKIIVLAEPQFWIILNKTISVGSEIEISKNFLPLDNWTIKPTFGIKWAF